MKMKVPPTADDPYIAHLAAKAKAVLMTDEDVDRVVREAERRDADRGTAES